MAFSLLTSEPPLYVSKRERYTSAWTAKGAPEPATGRAGRTSVVTLRSGILCAMCAYFAYAVTWSRCDHKQLGQSSHKRGYLRELADVYSASQLSKPQFGLEKPASLTAMNTRLRDPSQGRQHSLVVRIDVPCAPRAVQNGGGDNGTRCNVHRAIQGAFDIVD